MVASPRAMKPPGLPYLAEDLPPTGGVLRSTPEDFRVTEIPAYEPSGEGDHVFAWVEKRGVTTFEAVNRLARAVGVNPRDVGSAGLKDKHAVTTQYLSFPPPVAPEQLLTVDDPDISVVRATRHRNKMRTGHLRGNRFTLRIRQTDITEDRAAERAVAILARLKQPPGSPNWFGPQRFGNHGQNPAIGRALLGAGPMPAGMKPPRGKKRRLFISAFQSLLFNEYLRRRMAEGLYRTALAGDLLAKTDSGGVFCCDDPDTDNSRLAAGELVPTGPIFGHRMRTPTADSRPDQLEQSVLRDHDVTLESFKPAGKLAQGARRHLAIHLGTTDVTVIGPRAIEVSFDLPAGAYATVVMREIMRTRDAN